MPMRRPTVTVAAVALALLGLFPPVALAADAPDVTGSVIAVDGTPVAAASVQVRLATSDMVWVATTDAEGAWSVTAGIAPGDQLEIAAEGPETRSSPDPEGCVTSTTMTGQVELTVDSLPLAPVAVVLDTPVTGTVCAQTASPRPVHTLPATDAARPGTSGGGGGTALLVLGLAGLSVAAAATTRRTVRRPSRARGDIGGGSR